MVELLLLFGVGDFLVTGFFSKENLKMRNARFFGVIAGAALLVAGVSHADNLKSGPQVGKSPAPFHPTHVTGPDAGGKGCLV
jgi:hypothetical protein